MRTRRSITLTVLKLVVSGGLIALVLFRVDLDTVYDAASRLEPSTVGFCVAAAAFHCLASGYRWASLVRGLFGLPFATGTALRLYATGMFFSQLLLTFLGGAAVRAWTAHRRGMPFRKAVVGVALDSLTGFLSLALLASVSIVFLSRIAADTTAIIGASRAVATILLGSGLVLLADRLTARLMAARPVQAVAAVAENARLLLSRPLLFARLVSISVAGHLLVVAIAVAVARGIGEPLSVTGALAIVPPVLLVAALPISFAGWGVREAAMAAGFGMIGLNPVSGITVALVIGLSYLAVSLLGGIAWLCGGSGGRPSRTNLVAASAEFREP